MNHRLAGFNENLIILTQSTKPAEPCKRPFDNPAMGQEFETHRVIGSLNDLQDPLTEVFRPIDQLSRVSAVSPDSFQSRKAASQFLENQLGAVSILNVCGMNFTTQDQA